MRFTWNGRRLARILKDSVPIAFTYNEDGIRIMKEYYGVKTRYLLDGSNIVAQEVTNGTSLDYAYFFYDASGSPVGMNYLGNNYFYKKNIQSDIIEIWGTEDGSSSHSFRKLVSYTYDAWGNIVQMDDSTDNWYKIGTANPFRYRGYYYDNETGFYYLQSRYYDPVTGRFLNADDPLNVGENLSRINYNLFEYCFNNFVNMVDTDGKAPKYIDFQYDDYRINGVRMKDISLGRGNVSDNGCGVIAAYNVLRSRSNRINFNSIKNDIVNRKGLLWGGKLGVNPISLAKYMRTKFGFTCITGYKNKQGLLDIELSEAIIVLVKWKGFNGMHYIAGIKEGMRGRALFCFHNSGVYDSRHVTIDNRLMSFQTFVDYVYQQKASIITIIVVRQKIGRW